MAWRDDPRCVGRAGAGGKAPRRPRDCSVVMTDTTAIQTRVDQFLAETGLAARSPRVVSLTGDASDRRYFRVLLRDAPSVVLAVHPQAIDFERLPFANVARLMTAMPVPVPAILGHSDPLGIIALQDLGDV